MGNNQIHRFVVMLEGEINALREKAYQLEDLLRYVQETCPHPDAEIYRGFNVETCSVCLRKFLDKRRVDLIFAE